jgi:hypothetical protein
VRLHRCRLVLALALTAAACGDDPQPIAPTPAPAAFVRMDIDAPNQRAIDEPGGTVQLRALASFSDGTRPDVTNEAAWSVVDPRVLTVSRGLVTGLAIGGTIVTATYRGWSSVANVSVGPLGGPLVPVTGIVLDAGRGTPVAFADITEGGFEGDRIVTRTDGNGFFTLGERRGQVMFGVSKFGYENAGVHLPNVRQPTRLELRLTPNPGDYIERTIAGRFDPPAAADGESRHSIGVNTRAGGLFDAIVASASCAGTPRLRLLAESGGVQFAGGWGGCSARVRFVVPSSNVRITIVSAGVAGWQLTYREPR